MNRLELALWAIACGLAIVTFFLVFKKWGRIKEGFQSRIVDPTETDLSGTLFEAKFQDTSTLTLPDISGENIPVNTSQTLQNLILVAGQPKEILRSVEGKPGEYIDMSGNIIKGPIDTRITMTSDGPVMNVQPERPIIREDMDLAGTTCGLLSSEYEKVRDILLMSETIPNTFTEEQVNAVDDALKKQYDLNSIVQLNETSPTPQINQERADSIVVKNQGTISKLSNNLLIRKSDPNYSNKIEELKTRKAQIESTFEQRKCCISWGFTCLNDIPFKLYIPPS
jgi:hypothetical protein